MPSNAPMFSWCLMDLYSGSDENGLAIMSRSSFARSLFSACGMMFMEVTPSYARHRGRAGKSEARIDAEVKVEAAGRVIPRAGLARAVAGIVCGSGRERLFKRNNGAE